MKSKADALLEKLQARIEAAPRARPKLHLVSAQSGKIDAASRAVIIARIRDLARMYWLAWLVRQETEQVGGVVECLDDDALMALRDKMERARECRVEGIGFDEAGLVNQNTGGLR
jgi:hypothetical protein